MALMKHTLLFFALAALLTFTLALPLSPLVSPELIGRAGPAPSKCNGIKAANGLGQCNACVAATGCVFDRTTGLCVQAPTGRLDTNRFVTQRDATQCKPIAQGLQAKPTATEVQSAKAKQSAQAKFDKTRSQAQAEFERMRSHIFNGESNPTSGRHTFSAWTAKNTDAGRCDTATHLCAFRLNAKNSKTVWDDRSGFYTQRDIEDMCLAAITLNIVQDGPLASANFAIRTKLGNTICVQHLVTKDNTPSCFPVGIHALPAGTAANSRCTDTGIAVTTGTDLIAARS